MTSTYDQLLNQGLEQGLEQGREQGRVEGQAELLLEQVLTRFGAIPPEVEQRVRQADLDRLRSWGRRILSAATIDDVFDGD